MNYAKSLATKKPTCVGFFVEQNLSITFSQVQQAWLQPQELVFQQQEQQQSEQKQALQQQVAQASQRVEWQEKQVVELQTFHKRSKTGPTWQQPEQNFSFIFLSFIINGYKKHT